MWPEIIKENNIGIKLKNEFWNEWGPTHMFYFNPNLWDDTKEIKSIYCIYLYHHRVQFDAKEIAMGLHYECGEFGQHVALFSYQEIPNITYSESAWRYCVFPVIHTDIEEQILLYQGQVLMDKGIISERERYRNFLENNLTRIFDRK